MDKSYRRPRCVLQRELRVLNQKADRDLQCKLEQLEKQYRYTRKVLQQRRDSLLQEQRRVVTVKVCEPKATVDIAMREIDEHANSETNFRGIHTSYGRRPSHGDGSEPVEQSRSISAPPPSIRSPVRHRGNVQGSVSLMQMKSIATIDSISEKELAMQQQRAREEMERMRRFQRETLHKRVQDFIEKLREKGNMGLLEQSPEELDTFNTTCEPL